MIHLLLKFSSVKLVNDYDFGFKKEDRLPILSFLGFKGQYFTEVENSQKLYSRWGVFATLASAIPELFRVQSTEIAVTKDSIFYHNIYNIVLSLLVAVLLYKISGVYSRLTMAKFIFTMTILYSTYIFNYMRAQSYEILQLLLFLSIYYSIITGQKKMMHFSLWALILIKKVYLLLYIPVAFDLLYTRHFFTKKNFLQLCLSALIPLCLIAIANKLQFDTFFIKENPTDYPFDPSKIAFSLQYIPLRLKEYFIGAKASIFLFFIPLAFALTKYKIFYRAYKNDFIFIIFSFIIIFVVLVNFHTIGQACYGPRFLIFILPLLSLPALLLIDQFLVNYRQSKNIIGLIIFFSLSGYSTFLHSSINKHPYFLIHELQDYFTKKQDQEIVYYFKNTFSPFVVLDFENAIEKKVDYLPIEVKTRSLSEDLKRIVYNDFAQKSDAIFCNYYWSFMCKNQQSNIFTNI